jgi:hypothetical protein
MFESRSFLTLHYITLHYITLHYIAEHSRVIYVGGNATGSAGTRFGFCWFLVEDQFAFMEIIVLSTHTQAHTHSRTHAPSITVTHAHSLSDTDTSYFNLM